MCSPRALDADGGTAMDMGQIDRLDQLSEIEWRDVVKTLRPDFSDELIAQHWRDFQEEKRRRALH